MALINHTTLGFARERSSEGEKERHEHRKDSSRDAYQDSKDKHDN